MKRNNATPFIIILIIFESSSLTTFLTLSSFLSLIDDIDIIKTNEIYTPFI